MIFDFDLNLKSNPNYLEFLGTKLRSGKDLTGAKTQGHALSKVEGAAKSEEKACPLRSWRLGAITSFSDVRIHTSISHNPPSAPRE
jgi:hypothetical protein